MRSAWRFNDLKPRVYYCQGGRDYFASRYMKKIAVALMESIPNTTVRFRTNPERYLEHEFDRDYVVTWDFESFTSNLSELKYFMDEICQALEDFPEIEVTVFDSFKGLVKLSPIQMLSEYNEAVNIESPFSIHRIIHRYSEEIDPTRNYTQRNSGSLGVAGNIGFSTAWHGFAILETVGPDKGVSVGDDGLCVINDPNKIIGPLSEVAKLHPEKCTIVEPLDEDPFRFLKRAFYREPNGRIFRDDLFNLPNSALIFRDFTGRDVRIEDEKTFFATRIAKQTGALLWAIQYSEPPLSDVELEAVRKYLVVAYRSSNLPQQGCLPGMRTIPQETRYDMYKMAVPSIRFDIFDPRIGDWLEHLLYESQQSSFNVPVMGFKTPMPLPPKDSIVFVTKGAGWSFLEDFGYIERSLLIEVKDYLTDMDRDNFRAMIKRSNHLSDKLPLYRVEVIGHIPEIFDFMFTVSIDEDIWDVY